MRRLRLPEPCLVILVGAAGAGKSSLAARLFPPAAVLSSDAHRALVSGDAADQGATRTAFAILHRRLEERLAGGRTTVVDATNVTAPARRALVSRAARAGVPAVAIVLALDDDVVLARNAGRSGRVVPEAAVRRQLRDLRRTLERDALAVEGFAAVHLVTDPRELDALTLEGQR